MNDQLAWSIRLPCDEAGERVFEDQLEFVRELLARHFPASCGYEAQSTRLGGPMDGAGWVVTRGSFRAELGVQRFTRAGSGHLGRRPHTLRIVASAGLGETSALDSGVLERRVVGWAMASWSLGSVGLGALWLGCQGVLAGWAQVLLLLPAVATWRATMAMLVQRAGYAAALPPAPAPALPDPQLEDGMTRWRRLLPELRARREQLEDACDLPFRSPGHASTSPCSPSVTAPAELVRRNLSVPCP